MTSPRPNAVLVDEHQPSLVAFNIGAVSPIVKKYIFNFERLLLALAAQKENEVLHVVHSIPTLAAHIGAVIPLADLERNFQHELDTRARSKQTQISSGLISA